MHKLYLSKAEVACINSIPRNPTNGATNFGYFVEPVAYDFEVYTGKTDNLLREGELDCVASGNVVIRLAQSVPENLNYILFFDNYFTSPDLLIHLA